MDMLHFKPKSKVWRKGFYEGFSTYCEVWSTPSFERTFAIDSSVAMAWKMVGCALIEAEEVYRGEFGKASGKKKALSKHT